MRSASRLWPLLEAIARTLDSICASEGVSAPSIITSLWICRILPLPGSNMTHVRTFDVFSINAPPRLKCVQRDLRRERAVNEIGLDSEIGHAGTDHPRRRIGYD